MNRSLSKVAFTALFFWVSQIAFQGALVEAQDHESNLKAYLTDDVIAIAWLDLEKIQPEVLGEYVLSLGALNVDEKAAFAVGVGMVQVELDRWKESGIRKVYCLVKPSDVGHNGPSWVISVDPSSPQRALETIQTSLKSWPSGLSEFWKSFAVDERSVLIASSDEQLERLQSDRPINVRNYTESWAALGDGAAGFLVIPGNDTRRVLKEIPLRLPAPFEKLTGPMLADHLDWCGAQIDLSPQPNLKFEFEVTHDDTRAVILESVESGMALLSNLLAENIQIPKEDRPVIREFVQSTVTGNRLQISFGESPEQRAAVRKNIGFIVSKIRGAQGDAQDLNNLRQLLLGLHNYEGAFSRFPAFNGNGEDSVGLSWRVHILPFLNENELYQQFKLNEAWDSEHNLKLVEKMPTVFWSPQPENFKNNREGKTVYQGPLHPEAAFSPDPIEGFGFKDFKDGTSNSILLVTVTPDRAVPWTKPADWEVDLENPFAGLSGGTTKATAIGLADASTRHITPAVGPETLRRAITISGGEVFDYRDLIGK